MSSEPNIGIAEEIDQIALKGKSPLSDNLDHQWANGRIGITQSRANRGRVCFSEPLRNLSEGFRRLQQVGHVFGALPPSLFQAGDEFRCQSMSGMLAKQQEYYFVPNWPQNVVDYVAVKLIVRLDRTIFTQMLQGMNHQYRVSLDQADESFAQGGRGSTESELVRRNKIQPSNQGRY